MAAWRVAEHCNNDEQKREIAAAALDMQHFSNDSFDTGVVLLIQLGEADYKSKEPISLQNYI